MQPLRIDGLLNATVFRRQTDDVDALYVLGRRRMEGELALCRVHPSVEHVAYIAQPPGHVLEDPRFVGEWDGCLAFVAADAGEYFRGAAGWRIYQVIVYIDVATWKVRDVWRLASATSDTHVEKNWVPLGSCIDAAGRSALLHGHDTLARIELDHAARAQAWSVDDVSGVAPRDSAVRGDDVVGPPFVRGGTPLVRTENDDGWYALAHVQVGDTQTHPTGGWPIRQYVTTLHRYAEKGTTHELVPQHEARLAPMVRGAKIEFACGMIRLSADTALVALGLNDMDVVLQEVSLRDTTDMQLALPAGCRRVSYIDAHVPLPRPVPRATPTVCLNMIVKNESRIIQRLLASVLSVVDCYCICDTGSTDDTVSLIERFGDAHDLPGRIVHCPFYTFGYNRTFALNAARDMADYVLLLDADMVLMVSETFTKRDLRAAAYTLEQGSSAFAYHNTRLLQCATWSECSGATHEFYHVDGEVERLDTLRIGDIAAFSEGTHHVRNEGDGVASEADDGRRHGHPAIAAGIEQGLAGPGELAESAGAHHAAAAL